LASDGQIRALAASLQEQLEQSDPNIEQEDSHSLRIHDIALNPPPELPWSEGVEVYQTWTPVQLRSSLGMPQETVPFFNVKRDKDSNHDPWTDAGRQWLAEAGNGEPLSLRWHQLVGVLKMMENTFEDKPTLLMDGVGLGKTIQVSAYFALLIYYREYYSKHSTFPGKFSKLFSLSAQVYHSWVAILHLVAKDKWKGTDTNIPNLPLLVVVPVTLVSQLIDELHQYFHHGSVDVLPYLGAFESRLTWWTDYYGQCKNEEGRRIIVTTPTVSLLDIDIHLTNSF
jgi:hypothetical protein